MYVTDLFFVQEGYTALYISRRVNLNTTITETLSKVTVVTQTITIRRKPVSLFTTLVSFDKR